MKRPCGFTMIEIVIATAVAVVLLAAVHSTVSAMSRSAKALRTRSDEQAQFQRFLEILRRDLQGWCVAPEIGTQPATQNNAEVALKPFLRFSTTADTLTSEPSKLQRHSRVQYAIRSNTNGAEIVRQDSSSGSGEIVVWRTSRNLKIEFLMNETWSAEWIKKERPECIRIGVDTLQYLVVP